MPRLLTIVFFTVPLVGIAVTVAVGDDKQTRFAITTQRDSDRVEVRVENDKTAFVVHSPAGIGNMVIGRTDGKWPEVVVLRLHLKGLESFRVSSNGKMTLDAAVSSQADGPRSRIWKDGQEDTPLDSKNPLWMDIRMVKANGEVAKDVPLDNGYFEIPMPKAIFEDSPKSISVNWVDFYRN